MSTDMQQYSITNQSEVIALYAEARGLKIVRSYEDAGKSGLRLDGRVALKHLIDDVTSGHADFEIVLVYDVSRWGRFQDSDEGAYYEFICRQAGVAIEYCAEQFDNDGSVITTVFKNIKRAMAAEFSRELSAKVHAAQVRLAALGFRRGAAPGYGFRRYLVDMNGNRKTKLKFGEWKSIQTDRIILVPGPPDEIKTVRSMYKMFVEERMSLDEIARNLNSEGKTNSWGRTWLPTAVRDVLSNEKYIGHNVYNRTSVKLRGKWRRNPRSQWIRATNAFEPIVSSELFEKARFILSENRPYTENELLDSLTALWCQKGTISIEAMTTSPCTPSPWAYRRRFGSMMNAYAVLGFSKPQLGSRAENLKFRKVIDGEIIKAIRQQGGRAQVMPRNYAVRINDELSISTSIARLLNGKCYSSRRWVIGYRTCQKPDVLIAGWVTELVGSLRDYFFLPFILTDRQWFTFTAGNRACLEPFHSNSLAPLFELVEREPIQHLAYGTYRRALPFGIASMSAETEVSPGAAINDQISSVINMLRDILSDNCFNNSIVSEGLKTMPRLLIAPTSLLRQQGRFFAASVLEFVVVWAFVSKLISHPRISFLLNRDWPEFIAQMRATYLSISHQSPFAKRHKVK